MGQDLHGDRSVLKVYETGELTVIGFDGQDVPDEVCVAEFRDELMRLIDEHGCKVLAVDLSGVRLVPSGMLGLLLSLKKRVAIELFNPSDDVRDVLRITRLEQMFTIRELEQ